MRRNSKLYYLFKKALNSSSGPNSFKRLKKSMPPSHIKVCSWIGSSIKPHLSSIAKLRSEVLKESSSPWTGDLSFEQRYLRRHIKSPEAIAVAVFDGLTLIGVSTALPLLQEPTETQTLFVSLNWPTSSIFYFNESVLLKNYRGRGLAHHFFDIREKHVINQKKYQKICFFSLNRKDPYKKPSSDCLPLENFWRKRGFVPYREFSYLPSNKEPIKGPLISRSLLLWVKEI